MRSKPPIGIVIRRKLEVIGAHGLARVVRRVSRPRALAIADDLARFGYRAPYLRRNMNSARQHLEYAFGDSTSPAEREVLLQGSLRSLARTMVDFLRFSRYSREEFLSLCVEVDSLDNMRAFEESDYGAGVGLGMHIGSWEYAGAWWTQHHPMVAVGKAQREGAITRLAVETREAMGIEHVLSNATGSRKLIATLKRKDKAMLGLLADQNGGRDGLWVPVFGRLASSVKGPGFLMRRYGVPGLPAFAVWQGDYYKVIIGPMIHSVVTDDFDHDVLVNTARVQALFESMARQYPEQWFWLHKRWKTQPEVLPEEEREGRILARSEWPGAEASGSG